MAKVTSKVETVRYLIDAISYSRSLDQYVVEVLRADSANLAKGTGVGCTLFLSKEQVDGVKKFHDIRNTGDLRGAPMLCRVDYSGPNLLGGSTFAGNVY
jgi:hypothetical protein